jgi:signal transduction histidine kinase
MASRALLERRVITLTDAQDSAANPAGAERARAIGYRAGLSVPMLRGDMAIGAINVVRREAVPFTGTQVELLKTFADQAVIAIENTRLFEAEQASKHDLQESLEYQTATSEVLNVISRSPTDVQPVFDVIARSAARLCKARYCNVFRFDGQSLYFAAAQGTSVETQAELRRRSPLPPSRGFAAGRAILTNKIEEIPDIQLDPDYALSDIARARSAVGVPMQKDGRPIGAIVVAREQGGHFPERQIELLKTFADQAVIAIENTRLFEEVQARTRQLSLSLDQQTATSEVLRVISSSPTNVQPVFDAIVRRASSLCGGEHAIVTRYDGTLLHLAAQQNPRPGADEETAKFYPQVPRPAGSISGRALLNREVVHLPDIETEKLEPSVRETYQRMGLRAALCVPMLHEGRPIGVVSVSRGTAGPFSKSQIDLVRTFADQAVIAIENTRLFDEIARKGRELEIASQHKSQFVANMSHELRTPLAAILGYAELMQEGFYEPIGQKSMDALTRIRSNGKHLLGLINTVLDIAKIESGQFSLNPGEYALESVVETVRAATESLADTKKLALKTDVTTRLPVGLGDEQRLTQVLLNLVGNAIKFTDVGEVRITASAINDHFTVAVNDTGPGIPQAELKRIFEQFHQIDNTNTKAKGGTGLGLAIAKQIVEMHGGRIWVESTLGQGATFKMELPIRAAFRNAAQ